MNTDISLDAYPDKELTGKISYISPIAKATSSGVVYFGIVDIVDKGELKDKIYLV